MVYFIRYGNDGPVKIGIALGDIPIVVGHRLMTLQGNTPKRLKIIGFCKGGAKEERMLHEKFRLRRISGEWFDLKEKTIKFIENLCPELQEDKKIFNETISIDELAKLLQIEFNIDLYFQKIKTNILRFKKTPHYKAFGLKRFKYKESRDYLLRNGFLKKIKKKNKHQDCASKHQMCQN